MARRSRPEDLAVARLDGVARRHASSADLDVDGAMAELLDVPGVSPEKLAEAAGIALGFHRSDVDFESWFLAATLLVTAGADHSRLRHWMREGAQRRAIKPLAAR